MLKHLILTAVDGGRILFFESHNQHENSKLKICGVARVRFSVWLFAIPTCRNKNGAS
jgi:hypothetical protein